MPWQLWLAHQPNCWPSDHHSIFHHQLPHQPHHCTVGRLVITPTPLSADWSSLQHALLAIPSDPPPHCQLTGHHSNMPCRLPGHYSNIPCQLTGHHSNPTVGHPISLTTPLLATWSPLQHTLLADPSAPPPHCRLTGHHSNPTVGRLVTPPTYPVGHPISPTTPLSADPLLARLLCRRPGPLDRC